MLGARFLHKFSFVLTLVLALSLGLSTIDLGDARGDETRLSSEFGYQVGVGSQSEKSSPSVLYLEPAFKKTLEGSSGLWEFNAAVRGRLEPQSVSFHTDFNSELSLRALHLSVSEKSWLLKGGFQEIPWGETFGFSILDLVNPRDFRDPLILDPGWTKLPVAALNAQVFLDRLTLQGVFVPLPRNNQYPVRGSGFDLTQKIPELQSVTLGETPQANIDRFGSSSEYGGRASYLFENGLDLSLLYYRHWNRNPIYELSVVPAGGMPSFQLDPFLSQVHTVGMTASYGLGSLLLRNDGAVHFKQPLPSDIPGVVQFGTHWQNVIGVDQTLEHDLTWGVQLQTELRQVTDVPDPSLVLNWVSARVMQGFFKSKFEAEIFVMRGLGNSDTWVQPKLNWNISERWTTSLRYDWVGNSASQRGYLWSVQGENRALLWIRAAL